MKKYVFQILMIAVLVLFYSCKKDKDEKEASIVSVKFDDNTWTAKLSTAVYISASGFTAISGTYGISEHLQIIFKGNTTGTYNLTTDVANAYCSFTLMSGNIYSSVDANTNLPTGQINVTKYDQEEKLVSGTFHFTGVNFDYETKIFTDGVFTNVKLENR